MATTAKSAHSKATFSLRMSDLTHIVIQTGYTGRLNEHIPHILRTIVDKYNVQCDCVFTHDVNHMPKTFIPQITPEKEVIAEQILAIIEKHKKSDGVICFDVSNGHGFIGFDIIDLLLSTDYCAVYSNVSSLVYIQEEGYKILVLTYDSADDEFLPEDKSPDTSSAL